MKLQQRDTVLLLKQKKILEEVKKAYTLVQVLSVRVIYIRVKEFAILPGLADKCQLTAGTGEVSSQVLSPKTIRPALPASVLVGEKHLSRSRSSLNNGFIPRAQRKNTASVLS